MREGFGRCGADEAFGGGRYRWSSGWEARWPGWDGRRRIGREAGEQGSSGERRRMEEVIGLI